MEQHEQNRSSISYKYFFFVVLIFISFFGTRNLNKSTDQKLNELAINTPRAQDSILNRKLPTNPSIKKLVKLIKKEGLTGVTTQTNIEKADNDDGNRLQIESAFDEWPIKSHQRIFEYFFMQSSKNLQQNCKKYFPESANNVFKNYMNNNKTKNGLRINVDRKSGHYYCLPPKCGTSNFGYLISAIYQRVPTSKIKIFVPNNHQFSFVPYIWFYDKMRKDVLKTGKEFESFTNTLFDMSWEEEAPVGMILTRHPLTRLYSSWANRFSSKNPVIVKAYTKYVDTINENFHNNTTDEPVPDKNGMRVTFLAFFKFLNSKIWQRHRNFHWLPIQAACDYCNLKYDFIINQEDASRQSEIFLKSQNLQQYGPLGGSYTDLRGKSGGSISQSLTIGQRFAEIQKYYREKIPKELVLGVYENFKLDFLLFNYKLDGFI